MALLGGLGKALSNFNKVGDDGLSFANKLQIAGAIAQGDSRGAMALQEMFAERQEKAKEQELKQAAVKGLAALYEPQYQDGAAPALSRPDPQPIPSVGQVSMGLPQAAPQASAPYQYALPQRLPPISYSDPRAAAAAQAARAAGIDPSPTMDWLKNTGEQRYEEGVRYNPYGGNNPGFIPKRVEGAMTSFGPNGPTMTPIQGAADVAANMAGAVAGAQEGARSAFDLVDVPQADGSTRKMTRFQAAQILSGQGGALPPGLGVSQTPGARVTQEGAARTDVERAAAEPQQWSGLQSQARTTDFVIDQIDRALSMIGGAKDVIYRTPGGLEMGPGMTTGLGAILAGVPGTKSHNLASVMDTIRANVAFDKLQEMRSNSPTGGALGAVSDRENKLLASVLGSLDQTQSPEQLRANLKNLRTQLDDIRQQRQRLYNRTYQGGRQSAPRQGGGARWTPEEARAELARRRAMRGQ